MLRLSDPRICMEPKPPYSSWFKDPEEVAPRACHLRNGGSSSTAENGRPCNTQKGAIGDEPGWPLHKDPRPCFLPAIVPSLLLGYPSLAIALWSSRRRCRHCHVTIWATQKLPQNPRTANLATQHIRGPTAAVRSQRSPPVQQALSPMVRGVPPDDVVFQFCSAHCTVLIGETMSG